MAHLHRDLRLPPHGDRLGDRIEKCRALATNVARVERAPPPGADTSEGDDLGSGRIGAGRIDQSGGQSPGAGLDGIGQGTLHRRQLAGGRLPPREAHRGDAERAVADELHDVHGRAVGVERVEVLTDRAPAKVHAARQVEGEALEIVEVLVADGRRRETTVADYLGRHALADLGLGAAIGPQAPVRVGVHVDEPGRHDSTRGVDGTAGRLPGKITDGHDRLVAHAHIGAAAGRARAVDDGRALDLQVEH